VSLRRLKPGLAAGVAALALGLGIGDRPAAAASDHLVLGYYVPYDATSWASLQAHADQIDLVATQWVTANACGGIGSADDETLNQFARAHGLRVLPSLLTLSGWLNHRLLTEDEVSQQLIDQIVAYTVAEDYAGFDLDLEGVSADDRDALSVFVARAAVALHEQGKLLTLALPAKDRDVTVGWGGAYDYAALGADADLVTIMAYEFRGPFSGPGSVAPIDWVERVLGFATRAIPADKLLLGLAAYGYDWNVTSGGARSVGYPAARGLAEHYGIDIGFDAGSQSATFSFWGLAGDGHFVPPPPGRPAHEMTVHSAPPCDVAVPPPTPAPTPPPAPPPDTPELHEVWVEDAASAAARLDLATRYALRGIATWRLGLEDARVWPALAAFRTP
jgi:spore germination protein YaaH